MEFWQGRKGLGCENEAGRSVAFRSAKVALLLLSKRRHSCLERSLLAESNIVPEAKLIKLVRESNELTAILVTCVNNAKSRKPIR